MARKSKRSHAAGKRAIFHLITTAEVDLQAERARARRARRNRRWVRQRKALPRWWVVTLRSGVKVLFEGDELGAVAVGITGEGPFNFAAAHQLAWGGVK